MHPGSVSDRRQRPTGVTLARRGLRGVRRATSPRDGGVSTGLERRGRAPTRRRADAARARATNIAHSVMVNQLLRRPEGVWRIPKRANQGTRAYQLAGASASAQAAGRCAGAEALRWAPPKAKSGADAAFEALAGRAMACRAAASRPQSAASSDSTPARRRILRARVLVPRPCARQALVTNPPARCASRFPRRGAKAGRRPPAIGYADHAVHETRGHARRRREAHTAQTIDNQPLPFLDRPVGVPRTVSADLTSRAALAARRRANRRHAWRAHAGGRRARDPRALRSGGRAAPDDSWLRDSSSPFSRRGARPYNFADAVGMQVATRRRWTPGTRRTPKKRRRRSTRRFTKNDAASLRGERADARRARESSRANSPRTESSDSSVSRVTRTRNSRAGNLSSSSAARDRRRAHRTLGT